MMKSIAILGTVGIPASYGGFETLAENLARFHRAEDLPCRLTVYCSSKSYPDKLETCLGSELRYINLSANGVSSIVYDVISLFSAAFRRHDAILLLGVSGAIALPMLRLCTNVRIVTNVDGMEWRRAKWSGLARCFLRLSEWLAVRFSHEVITDNKGIAEHIATTYGRSCHVVAYGGDHAIRAQPKPYEGKALPSQYVLAIGRIEAENNVGMILDAFARMSDMSLVFVGNWNYGTYGRKMKQRFEPLANLYLLDSIYDIGVLRSLRANASLYVHGHSEGGTNPSLVEMMHFGLPIIAYDCIFNRYTTEGKALFFKDADDLRSIVDALTPVQAATVGAKMRRIALQQYTWDKIGRAYFDLLEGRQLSNCLHSHNRDFRPPSSRSD
jgi:glycosyltransferase involved in cell wall biosynthesis